MEELQKRIEQLEAEKSQLNPNVSDDVFRIRQINAEIEQIKAQIEQKAAEDQKFDELKGIVEAANLNEVLGHPDAAKIVHAILYDQSLKHLSLLNEKDATIKSMQDQFTSLESHYTNELQQAIADAQKVAEENTALKSDLELSKNESRNRGNEIERQKQQISSLNQQLETEKARRSELKPSGNLQELLQNAKAVTEQRKIKITNVQPTNAKETHYTAITESGEQVTIPYYAMGAYERVERLPLPESKEEPVSEEQFPPGREAVAESAVASEVSGDAGGATSDEAVQGTTLEERVAALEVWRRTVDEGIAGLTFQR